MALYVALGALALLFTAPFTAAQEIGQTICGCQPAVYEVTLRFDVTCDDSNVSGPGINETACITSAETEEEVTDFTPVLITNVQFLEQNSEFTTLQQIPINGDFRDGDIVTYTSVLVIMDEFTGATMPRAFQMILRGINALDQPIQVTWVITYDNDCGIFPILFEGQQMGWSVFTDLGAPPSFVCPLAGDGPTPFPTVTPAVPATPAPVEPDQPDTEPPVMPPGTASPTETTEIVATPAPAPTKPDCPPVGGKKHPVYSKKTKLKGGGKAGGGKAGMMMGHYEKSGYGKAGKAGMKGASIYYEDDDYYESGDYEKSGYGKAGKAGVKGGSYDSADYYPSKKKPTGSHSTKKDYTWSGMEKHRRLPSKYSVPTYSSHDETWPAGCPEPDYSKPAYETSLKGGKSGKAGGGIKGGKSGGGKAGQKGGSGDYSGKAGMYAKKSRDSDYGHMSMKSYYPQMKMAYAGKAGMMMYHGSGSTDMSEDKPAYSTTGGGKAGKAGMGGSGYYEKGYDGSRRRLGEEPRIA